MKSEINVTLGELFEDLEGIYEKLRTGVSLLAMLEKAAESPEMTDALGFVAGYLRSAVDDMGILVRTGERQVTEPNHP